MTPNQRRKLFRNVIALIIVAILVILGRVVFLDQSLPTLILGRKSDSLPAGTILIQNEPGVTSQKDSEIKSFEKLNFDILGGWKFVDGKTPLPANVKELNGKWVQISGFMFSGNNVGMLKRFILVQSLWSCCFGQAPDMNHFIDISLPPGKISQPYFGDPVTITGKLSASELRENGRLVSLYRLEAHQIVVK